MSVSSVWAVTYNTTVTGIVGATDNTSGFNVVGSKQMSLAAGDEYVITFVNYNKGADGTNYWANWAFISDVFSCRADHGASNPYWGSATNVNYTGSSWTDISSTINEWLQAYNGVTVTLTVSRNAAGTGITVSHTATTNAVASIASQTYAGTFTATVGAETAINFHLTVENAHLKITKVLYSNDAGGTIYTMPQMTYVNYSDADHSYGEIAYGETAETGYNRLDGTYPSQTVGFVNTGWGVNYITYINADASDVPGGATMTTASLSFSQSGSTDSKRTTGVGAGYNSSTWSSSMTYNTAEKSITTVGDVVWTSTTSASVFESKSISILAAFSGDADNIVNILLYETAAAGCYIKNPELSITYTTAAAYNITFTETNSVAATIKIDDTDVTAGTTLVNGDYSFTATAAGYEDYNGNFTVNGADMNVEFTMTAKIPVTSITVNYKYNNEIVFSEAQSNIAELYVGNSYEVPFRMYVMNGGTLYKSTKRGSNPWYGEPTTLTANTVIERAVTPVNLGGGTVILFEDLDNSTAQNASIRASYCSAYDNRAYTSAENLPAGTYDFIVYAQNKNRGSSVKIGDTTVFSITDVVSSTGAWQENTISNVTVPIAGQLTFVAGGSSTYDDYDIIIAVLKSVPATIGSTGWTTFASSYPLDLSNMTASTDDVTAYYASAVNNGSVTMTSTESSAVAAGEGLMLKGTAGATITIPVVASGTAIEGNKLVGCTTSTVLTANSNYYVLVNNSGTAEFQCLDTNGATIPAGKAYLNVPSAGANLRISFDADETTGINIVECSESTTGIYNLSGQRVMNPTKGLYIMNGKKVYIK